MKEYLILNVPYPSDLTTIKKSYKSLCKIHHPDKGGHPELFKILNESFNTLKKRLELEHIKSNKYSETKAYGKSKDHKRDIKKDHTTILSEKELISFTKYGELRIMYLLCNVNYLRIPILNYKYTSTKDIDKVSFLFTREDIKIVENLSISRSFYMKLYRIDKYNNDIYTKNITIILPERSILDKFRHRINHYLRYIINIFKNY